MPNERKPQRISSILSNIRSDIGAGPLDKATNDLINTQLKRLAASEKEGAGAEMQAASRSDFSSFAILFFIEASSIFFIISSF
jgi:hypothetical protein